MNIKFMMGVLFLTIVLFGINKVRPQEIVKDNSLQCVAGNEELTRANLCDSGYTEYCSCK